jgi:hypothetical protein
MWELYDAEPANLQEPGQSRRSRYDPIGNIHLIIGYKLKAAREKTEHEVGLPRPRRSHEKDRILISRYAAPMHTPMAVHEWHFDRIAEEKEAACGRTCHMTACRS